MAQRAHEYEQMYDHAAEKPLASGRDGEIVDREQPAGVEPVLLRRESRVARERAKLVHGVLVGALRVYGLARRDRNDLLARAFEMHLDAAVRRIVDSAMDERVESEVAAELGIHAPQHVQ